MMGKHISDTRNVLGIILRTPAVWPSTLCQASGGRSGALQWRKFADKHT